MPKKSKPQRITFGSIIRLIIFGIIVYLLISWFSQKSTSETSINDPTLFIGETVSSSSSNIFTNLYNRLPENSRHQLENFNQTQAGKFISNSTEFVKSKLDGFPQKQIKEIKKGVIKNISDDMIKNIDQN
jgi:hypothetical protein